jgi:hypothetical protein
LYKVFFFEKENSIIYKLKEKTTFLINYCYWDNMFLVDHYIKHKIMGPKFLGQPLVKLTKIINKFLYDRNSTRYKKIFFFIDLLPKTFLVILHLTDIIFFHEFYYIYKFGWIGIIPMIFRYIIYTFKEFAEYNIRSMHEEVFYFFTLKGEELSTVSLIENCKNIYHIDTIDSFGIPQRRVALRQEAQTEYENNILIENYMEQFDSFMQIRMSVDVMENLRKSFAVIFFMFDYYFLCFYLWLYIFYYSFFIHP